MPISKLLKSMRFTSPLIERELWGYLRHWRSFWVLFLFLLALQGILVLNWKGFTMSWGPGGDVSRAARSLFYFLAQGQLIFIVLITPFMAAPLFAGEREKKTLDLILSSPISVFHLMLSKIVAPLIYFIFILISGIPVLSICLVGGGISQNDIFRTYLVCLSASVVSAALGLFCSTLSGRIANVNILTVIVLLVSFGVVPFHGTLWYMLSDFRIVTQMFRDMSFMHSINHGLLLLNPFLTMNEIHFPHPSLNAYTFQFYTYLSPFGLRNTWLGRLSLLEYYLILNGLFSLLLMSGTIFRMKRIAKGIGRWKVRREKIQYKNWLLKILMRDLTEKMMIDDPLIDRTAGSILERRSHWMSHPSMLIRVFSVGLIISMFFVVMVGDQVLGLFFIAPLVLTMIVTLPATASRISVEREQGTLDLLRTTLLPLWDYITRKIEASHRFSFLFSLALFFPGLLAYFALPIFMKKGGSFPVFGALIVYPIYLFFALRFYVTLALFCSAYFRKTSQALIGLAGFILMTWCLPLLLPGWMLMTYSSATTNVRGDPWLVIYNFICCDIPHLIEWLITKLPFLLSPLLAIEWMLPVRPWMFGSSSVSGVSGATTGFFQTGQIQPATSMGFLVFQGLLFIFLSIFLTKLTVWAVDRQD